MAIGWNALWIWENILTIKAKNSGIRITLSEIDTPTSSTTA
jgi:hypothetical protein